MLPREGLEGLRFLHGLRAEYLDQIAAIAEARDVPADGFVFREGEASAHVFVVASGRISLLVRVPGHGPVRVHTLGEGELLGWTPLLGAGVMTATARAAVPSRLVALHAPQLLALIEHDPRLGVELMRRVAAALAQRLNSTRLQLLDVYHHELPDVPEGVAVPPAGAKS
jgi:CRP-like cAMP-binding protein